MIRLFPEGIKAQARAGVSDGASPTEHGRQRLAGAPIGACGARFGAFSEAFL